MFVVACLLLLAAYVLELFGVVVVWGWSLLLSVGSCSLYIYIFFSFFVCVSLLSCVGCCVLIIDCCCWWSLLVVGCLLLFVLTCSSLTLFDAFDGWCLLFVVVVV